jgi:hypothetical protein
MERIVDDADVDNAALFVVEETMMLITNKDSKFIHTQEQMTTCEH